MNNICKEVNIGNEKVEESDDDEGDVMANLFICEEYVARKFTFWNCQQTLLCSNMSSTDHDLTGQIVWPASKSLSWFIAKNGIDIFSDKVVVELGAGCGLGGFIASHFSKFTSITDGNEIVLKLIKRNIDEIGNSNCAGIVRAAQLIWGHKNKVIEFLQETESPLPDIIIGADVILWPQYTQALLLTIRWILALKPSTSKCYISYVTRAQSTTDLLYKLAEEMGLIIKIIDLESFLPTSEEVRDYFARAQLMEQCERNHAYFERAQEMFLLDISLDKEIVSKNYPEVQLEEKCNLETLDVSTLFKALPSEEDTWNEFDNNANRPY